MQWHKKLNTSYTIEFDYYDKKVLVSANLECEGTDVQPATGSGNGSLSTSFPAKHLNKRAMKKAKVLVETFLAIHKEILV